MRALDDLVADLRSLVEVAYHENAQAITSTYLIHNNTLYAEFEVYPGCGTPPRIVTASLRIEENQIGQ